MVKPPAAALAVMAALAAAGCGAAGAGRVPSGALRPLRPGNLLVTMNQRDDLASSTPGDYLGVVRFGDQFHFPSCFGQGGAVGAASAFPTGVRNPVAVALGPDGAVYVGDWSSGTLYRVTGANTSA